MTSPAQTISTDLGDALRGAQLLGFAGRTEGRPSAKAAFVGITQSQINNFAASASVAADGSPAINIEPTVTVTDTAYPSTAHETYTVSYSGFLSGDLLSASMPPGGGGGTTCGGDGFFSSSGTYATNDPSAGFGSAPTPVTAADVTTFFESFTFSNASSTQTTNNVTTTTTRLHDVTVTFADTNSPGTSITPASQTVTIHVVPAGDALTVAANNTTLVTAAQTYTGATQVSGMLDINAGGAIATSSQVALNASGAVLDITGAGAGGAAVAIKQLSGVAGSMVKLGAGVLSVTESAAATYAGVISGTGALVVNGAAALTLTGVETYTGKTQVSGELDLGAAGSVASSQQVALKASGAVFDVSGASAGGTVTIQELSGVAGSTIKLGGGVLSLTESVAASYSGAITNGGVAGGVGGGLVVNGTAPLTLTGTNTFTGKTQIYGELDLAGSAVLNQSKAVTLKASGAVFDISGATVKEAILNLAGVAGSHIYLGANSLKINDTTAATYAGVISDGGAAGGMGGSLIVKGTVPLNLTGANTFTGGVTLQTGTLELGATTAAGVGHALTFAGAATLQLDAGALGGSGAAQTYGTAIAGFAQSDHIDLASLAYASGATATYDGSTLTVTSGGNSVALTLTGLSAATGFTAADDGHGHVLVGLVGVL